jgi:hypothetical protein
VWISFGHRFLGPRPTAPNLRLVAARVTVLKLRRRRSWIIEWFARHAIWKSATASATATARTARGSMPSECAWTDFITVQIAERLARSAW